MMSNNLDGQEQLDAVAEKLCNSILGLVAEAEYGTEGRETMGGTMMAGLARALVAVRKEIRDTAKAQAPKDDPGGKIVMMAPAIPKPLPKPKRKGAA